MDIQVIINHIFLVIIVKLPWNNLYCIKHYRNVTWFDLIMVVIRVACTWRQFVKTIFHICNKIWQNSNSKNWKMCTVYPVNMHMKNSRVNKLYEQGFLSETVSWVGGWWVRCTEALFNTKTCNCFACILRLCASYWSVSRLQWSDHYFFMLGNGEEACQSIWSLKTSIRAPWKPMVCHLGQRTDGDSPISVFGEGGTFTPQISWKDLNSRIPS